MKAQFEALKSKLKKVGNVIGNKLDEATMGEHELRVKHGVEKPESSESKLAAAKEATTMPKVVNPVAKPLPAPSVMRVGKRIIK
jgi:hypothetical protein